MYSAQPCVSLTFTYHKRDKEDRGNDSIIPSDRGALVRFGYALVIAVESSPIRLDVTIFEHHRRDAYWQ
jgi:hypothetical protein